MMPSLFDSMKPAMSKQHYERFNLYINFQTKSGHLTDPVKDGIDLFKHTLDKTALVWFQMNRSKFKDLTTLKTMFLQRYNPWGKTKREQCKDWATVKDTAKSLEHIIMKCDPPTPAMPMMATGATVPGLYSHIVHSVDKEEGEIPQPFKGARPKQTRGRGKPKGKPQEQRQNPPKTQEADETYTYENPKNYYHNVPSQS